MSWDEYDARREREERARQQIPVEGVDFSLDDSVLTPEEQELEDRRELYQEELESLMDDGDTYDLHDEDGD